MAFFTPGCICSLIWIVILNYLKISKKSNKNACVHLHVLHTHKVVLRKKNDFLCVLCKNDKNGTKVSLFAANFVFYAQPIKNVHFPRNFAWAYI
jgi:hypothetical protein